MKIRVFDMDNVERDLDWAKAKYGVAYRLADVAPGQKVYRLVELREKTGYHSLITKVLNEDGLPIHNLPVTFFWPDAPDPPEPPTTVYPWDWYKRFIWGPTNMNGDVGPGMGKGAYHGWGEGGPHAVWVHDPNIPSDICEKLGMLAGTPHDHLDQKFQLMVVGEGNGNGDGNGGDEPEPEPSGWTMTSEARPGISLLIGKGLPDDTPVTVASPWGHRVTVKAGSKKEHGKGGWEVNIWHVAEYTISFPPDAVFKVVVDNCTVTCTFIEGEPPEEQARLVSTWMDKYDAEVMLQRLEQEQQFRGVFSLES